VKAVKGGGKEKEDFFMALALIDISAKRIQSL
jgi:hypothetical protein